MAAFSDYLEELILNHLFRTGSWTKPTVLAFALCTAAPTDTSTGATITEVADANGYARVTANPLDATWSDPSAGTQGETDNVGDIDFGTASGAWGTVTHFALCDSATHGAGNLLIHGALTTSKAITNGDPVKFAAGEFNFSLD